MATTAPSSQEFNTSGESFRDKALARDSGIVAIVYTASLLFVAGFPHMPTGFPLDDSWIHQVVARNLVQYHTLGFIPGVWSSGSSSLLWTFILAPKYLMAISLSPVIYTDLLNLLIFVFVGIGLLAMARSDDLPEYLCWIFALGPSIDGNFVWLGVIGMEHMLFVMLSVAAIYFWFRTGTQSAVFAALCLGALSLTRPEGLVLSFMLVCISRRAGRNRKAITILGVVVGACVLLFLLANLKTSHSLLPMTYAGRKWLYFGSTKVPLRRMVMFPLDLVVSTLRPWLAVGANLAFILPAVLIFLGIWRLCRRRSPRLMMLCLWMLALAGVYSVMLPSLFDMGRYQSLLLCLSLPLLFAGLDSLLRRAGSSRGFLKLVLVTLCVLCAVQSLSLWRRVTRAGIMLVQESHERAAAFVAATLPPKVKFAALDIGAMGYIDGPARITDLGGLTDHSYLPYLQEHRIMDYIDERHVRYLVWVSRPDGSSDLRDMLDITPMLRRRFELLALFCANKDDWAITGYHAQCQAVYRIKN